MFRFRSKKLTSAAALVALASAACVHAGPGTVKVNPIEANLAFGVRPQAVTAPLPSQAAQDLIPAISEGDVNVIPTLPSLTPPKSACPEAPVTAVVETPTEVQAIGKPLIGVTKWKHSGYVEVANAPGGRAAFTGFEKRIVRNYNKVSDTEWTFDIVQPVPAAQVNQANGAVAIVNHYKVKTNGFSETVNPPAGPVSPPSVGEPERGLVLTGTESIDRTGSTVGTSFAPVTGLLLLPLPVASGESFASVAADPKSGETVIQNSTVSRRQRIDACGDLVDGWQVTSTQLFIGLQTLVNDLAAGKPPSLSSFIGYDYIVATQFGGMIVDERIYEADLLNAPDALVQTLGSDPFPHTPSPFDLDFSLGQLHPDPLPAS